MTVVHRGIVGAAMAAALLFGFLHPLYPDAVLSFNRLHIFLFNLVSGGALILYHSEGHGPISAKVVLYFALSSLYALSAAAGWYPAALALSLPLVLVVEWVRVRRFSLFPADFFRRDVPVSAKFNQASLLCLSCGIAIASLVIANNEYLHFVHYEKLTLNIFFLGYSFPISLIVLSIMFSFIPARPSRGVRLLEELAFWLVNLGVIAFFLFIVFEALALEMVAATTLTATVLMIFILFRRYARDVQQKSFLLSGITFLVFTAVTGIFYVLKYLLPVLDPYKDYLLTLHAMVSLYGWNLSGLFIILRWRDFPIRLSSRQIIVLHWMIVLVLAPLGKHVAVAAPLAMAAYLVLLYTVLFGAGGRGVAAPYASSGSLPTS